MIPGHQAPRLLFFAHETSWSGAPIQLLHLVRWLTERRWDVAVAVPKTTARESGPISRELTRLQIETFPVLDLAQVPDFAQLRSLCATADVVIANTLVMWAPIRAAHDERVASIWSIHESSVARQLVATIHEIQPTLALADFIVVPTRPTGQLYAALTDRTFEVVPYGIPVPSPAVRSCHDHSGSLRFLLLGTYESRKGQDVFLEAIARIPMAGRERAVFRMAGRALEPEFYQRVARQAQSLPNVEILEALEHDEACAAIAAADVLVCASRDETMPIAILEAMSLGKAVVSTDVGGISEWLSNGANALLVPSEDSTRLAAALVRCLTEPALRQSLGASARHTFHAHFSLDQLGERFTALIRRALELKKR